MTWKGMPPRKYQIYSMLPKDVMGTLPPPFTEARTRRIEEELLKCVNVPQGNRVLRCRCYRGQNLFWVETVK